MRNIIFSDECLVSCVARCRGEWRGAHGRKGEPVRKLSWTAQVHVWGAIGVGYKKLVFLDDGRVNADDYIDTLNRFLLPRWDPNKIFMQDGAPAHTAKATMEWLKNNNIKLLPWAANSPDLNPIEFLWARIKATLKVRVNAGRDELIKAVETAWNGIDQKEIDALVGSFHGRVNKMQENDGDSCDL